MNEKATALRNPRQALQLINSLRGPAQAQRQDLLRAALERWPKDLRLAICYASFLRDRTDFYPAFSWLEGACTDHPTAVRPRVLIADLLYQLYDDGAATIYLEEAIKLRPNSLAVISRLAATLYRQERYAEAEPHYHDWLSLVPTNPRPMLDMAHLYVRTDRPQESEHMLQRVLAIAPRHIDAIAELAFVFMSTQRYAEAESMLRAALEADPRTIYSRLLGGVLVETGRFAEAEPLLRDVLEIEPMSSYVLARLARICAATDRREEAKKLAIKAMDPSQRIAADLLHALVLPRLTEDVARELASRTPGSKQEAAAASILKGLLLPHSTVASAAANDTIADLTPSTFH